MKVEAFIICFNEADTIRLTIDHYKQICDKVTFYDNHSDDGTQEIIKSNGCELIPFGTVGKLEDREYIKIKNNCWKGSQADWVIVCDSDEIIWHPELNRVLEEEKTLGNTVFHTVGWDIFSDKMPNKEFFEITTGIQSLSYSKIAVFSPKIRSINYVYGCHVADPCGSVTVCKEKLNLFHYRNIGGVQRLINRHELYRNRLSDHNKRLGLGIHYTYDDEKRRKDWKENYLKAIPFDSYGLV